MGNKIIRKREFPVSAAGSGQEPVEDQKTTELGASNVTPAQQTVPAEEVDVVIGQEATQTPCLPNEECVSAPAPMSEARVEVDCEAGPGQEKDQSSSPSLDVNTDFSSPQPTVTPQTPILEDKVADVAAAEGSPDDTEAAVSSALDPDTALKSEDAGNLEAGTDGNLEQEESLSKGLKELSLTGNDPDLIDDTPLDVGVSAEPVGGSEDA
ncbi:uncharacterized protein LOC109507651 [Hippocampus comes]|uniref:uncharacterized protein LOC109507651 n=1 Tax=Hippocampus comes TaxID=109280 RepID=UPI00094E4D32|nr:PREDICTED: uncharacterized protein LOC109507651 [Hippocampus comes]